MSAAAAADRPDVDERIVGGTPATRSWPAQGYLRRLQPDGRTFVCGGTLVSGRWFLTAAHCVTDSDGATLLGPGAFQITLGRSDRSSDPVAERDTVDAVIRHESYMNPVAFASDLALLHISSTTAPNEQPLGIVQASESALWAAGTTATAIGWGTTSSGGTTPETRLREATVPIVTDVGCASAYGTSFAVTSMVCAGNGNADTCQGDSGGPLMVPRQGDFVLAGITSWGAGCADPEFPGVYTRIGTSALNSWIRSRIPTAAITVTPPAPGATDAAQLTATATAPASQAGSASFSWDLDDDGLYDDATGPTAALPPALAAAAGTYPVRVQSAYPDGDRGVHRAVVTVSSSTAPAPDPDPAPASTVAATSPLAPVVATPTTPTAVLPPKATALPALARLLDVPDRVRLSSLLDHRTSVRVMCATACDIEAVLRVDRATARRAGLTRGKRNVRIGSGSARFPAAKAGRVVITLTRTAVRALRKVRRGNLLLNVTVTAAGDRAASLSQVQRLRP